MELDYTNRKFEISSILRNAARESDNGNFAQAAELADMAAGLSRKMAADVELWETEREVR